MYSLAGIFIHFATEILMTVGGLLDTCSIMEERIIASKDVYALIPTTSERLVTWQMGTKVADGIKVADQLT